MSKRYSTSLFAAFIFLLTGEISYSQVMINEYSASNLETYKDDFGKEEDWLELYNTGDTEVDISGYFLSDKLSKPTKWRIPNGSKIPAKGYYIFWLSGRDSKSLGSKHTNFKLTQTKLDEYVILSNPQGVIIDQSKCVVTQLGHSVAREMDGNGVWKVSTTPSPEATNNGGRYYLGYADSPKLDSLSGFYPAKIKATITSDTIKYVTRFTITGNKPLETSPIYTKGIDMDRVIVFKAVNFPKDSNYLPSHISFATYFVKAPTSSLPIISVGGTNVTKLADGDRELTPEGSIEIFDKNFKRISTSYGRVESHGQDSWVNDQRSLDWISRDEMGHSNAILQKLFNYTDREEFQRIILRASGDDNYPATTNPEHRGSAHVRDEYVHTLVQESGMELDIRALERYIVYLNGRYWGVYTIREKPDDHDYIEYNYDQDKYNIQFLKTWGESWAEYGGDKAKDDWVSFRDTILNGNFSDENLVNYVKNRMNITSLFDYMICNLSVVSSDWLNYNTGWYRGLDPKGKHKKWGYVMWDNDATFDYYINYSGVPNTNPDAQACDITSIAAFMDEFFPQDTMIEYLEADSFFINGMWEYIPADTFVLYPDLGKHEKIFIKMLEESEILRNEYLMRYADMNSVAFSCENMLSKLDSLVAIIRPEMPRHITRWGGQITTWESNVKKLRSFVESRCQLVNTGLADCYNLSGPFGVTIMTNPTGAGEIKFNTINHTSLPWTGQYFGNMTNEIKVTELNNNKFVRWVSKNGSSSIESAINKESKVNITSRDTLIAIFENAVSTSNDFVNHSLSIHPNPASDYIEIKAPFDLSLITNIELKSVSGNVTILKTDNYSSGVRVNIKNVPPGFYTITMSQAGINYVDKLVILR